MPKDIKYLSERRKYQLINHEINLVNNPNVNNPNVIHSTILNTSCTVEQLCESDISSHSDEKRMSSIYLQSDTQSNNERSIECANSDNILCEYDTSSDSDEYHTLSAHLQSDTQSNNDYSIECEDNIRALTDISNNSNKTSLCTDLQKLIVKHNIPHVIGNELLEILKRHGHIELPGDVRVLLKTPRNASKYITSIGNGRYVHFGLFSNLERCIKTYMKFIKNNEIKLNINIDGLPISKSSGSQFWPIMASIEGIDIDTVPFIIAVYHGMCKPSDANEFLTDFVNEFILLSKNGIIVCNIKYTVVINAILCDAPAKSFITYTKGHTGYFSCSKCIQEGDFIHNRVTFPETNNTLRTNETFRNRTHIEHHTGDSILEKLPIGMITQIPLDYMHLVCLGVMKRMLQLWLKGSKNIRLSKENINTVSYHLMSIKTCVPSEFARKPRHLYDVDKWKATEFRQFLLYTAIVVMKSVLSSISYTHFLSLSVAIRILSDLQTCVTFNAYANSLLLWFVSNYGNIFGDEFLSHNVHNLLHLANDVKQFGPLDNFSCFKFENNLQKIKRRLHQSGKPLEELWNRISEELQLPIEPYDMVKYPNIVYNKNKISYIQFQTFQIALNEANNCALLHDNSVVFISDIFEQNDIIFIRAQHFLNPDSVFTSPCASEKLGIFLILPTTTFDVITVPITQIKNKCFKIKYLHEVDSYVTIPLLHTDN